MPTQKYRFAFRTDAGEVVTVLHDTRTGDAENCARKMARLVAKKKGARDVTCIWYGPEGDPKTMKLLAQSRKEAGV